MHRALDIVIIIFIGLRAFPLTVDVCNCFRHLLLRYQWHNDEDDDANDDDDDDKTTF